MEEATPFFNVVRPSRIAGGLLVWSAVLAYFGSGRVSAAALVLGLALILTQETSRLDVLRLAVFAWALVSLAITIPAALYEGLWFPAISAALFGGALVGLMLEGLRESQVAILALVGFGILFF